MALPGDAYVYEGAVKHQRFKPVRHKLRYNVFSFLLDLDALDETAETLNVFSRNKFNFFSFYDRDFARGEGDVAKEVRQILSEAGFDGRGRILLLCYPRMLGYAFNPLSVYYCHDVHGKLSVILYEVRNTFGGKHSYLIPVAADGKRVRQCAEKVFHVSPFIDMDMHYHFALSPPSEDLSVFIQTADREGPLLNAIFKGEACALSDQKLRSLFLRYPMMTLKVILGIHWEAVKLFAKGLRLRPGSPTSEHAVTIVRDVTTKLPEAA